MNNNRMILVLVVAVLVIGAIAAVAITKKKAMVNPASPASSGLEVPAESVITNPEPADSTAGWLVYTDSQGIFSFKYPASFGANVWKAEPWPPVAVYVPAGQDPLTVGCPDIHDETGKIPTATSGKTTGGMPYSLYLGSDIGAGQLYSSYCYVFVNDNGGAAVIDFVIRSHSACGFGGCGAYCGTQYESECTDLDRETAIADPITQMAETFIFTGAVTGTTQPAGVAKPDTAQPDVSAQPEAAAGKTVTLVDNQTNIALGVGDTFLLKLGEGYDWSVTVVDNAIVDREKNVAVVRGAQGIYKALAAGDTDVTATGDPVCRSAPPPCALASIMFVVHAAVR